MVGDDVRFRRRDCRVVQVVGDGENKIALPRDISGGKAFRGTPGMLRPRQVLRLRVFVGMGFRFGVLMVVVQLAGLLLMVGRWM